MECESQIVGNNLIFLLLLWLVCVARLHSTVQTTAAASVITFSSPCEVDFVQWFVMTMNNCFGKSSCCIMGESVLKCDILLDNKIKSPNVFRLATLTLALAVKIKIKAMLYYKETVVHTHKFGSQSWLLN